jgi:hypothetical protein
VSVRPKLCGHADSRMDRACMRHALRSYETAKGSHTPLGRFLQERDRKFLFSGSMCRGFAY